MTNGGKNIAEISKDKNVREELADRVDLTDMLEMKKAQETVVENLRQKEKKVLAGEQEEAPTIPRPQIYEEEPAPETLRSAGVEAVIKKIKRDETKAHEEVFPEIPDLEIPEHKAELPEIPDLELPDHLKSRAVRAAEAAEAPATKAEAEVPETEKEKEEKAAGEEEEKEEKEAVKYLSEQEKLHLIDSLMTRLGQSIKDDKPAVIAIKTILINKIKTEDDIKKLEAFLGSGEFEDEIDQLVRQNTPDELKKIHAKLIGQMAAVSAKIDGYRKQLRKLPQNQTETIQELSEKIGELETRKEELGDRKRNIKEALERQKQKKEKETIYYSNKPEKLLGMINLHFAKQDLERGKTPDYERILEETHKQIENAKKQSHWLRDMLKITYKTLAFPASFLKPTLTGTLKAISEKDETLQKVKPEQADKLAKLWNDPHRLENWIQGLEGTEKENMRTVVPALIGHLSEAVNIGGWSSYMNNLSVLQARGLLKQLRRIVHQYSMAHAETTKGTNLDKMEAYFGRLNQINRKADTVRRKIIKNNMNKVMARNVFIGAGTTAGAVSLAGLSGVALATAGVASTAGVALGSSFRIKNPKIKAFLQKQSVRGLAAGGLGALALGVTPWLAAPLIAGGLFTPEIWKNRDKIKTAMVKHSPTMVRGMAKTGVKTAYVAGRGAWAYTGGILSLLALGLPLFNRRYRNFFGMHFRPLFGK